MVELEYNKEKVYVPENWDEIKLGLYESVTAQRPTDVYGRVSILAEICGVEAETLLAWPSEVFNTMVDITAFFFKDNPAEPKPSVEIAGVKYVVPIEEELTLGAWIDADEAQKQGVNVMSNVLAIVCRPVGEEYKTENSEARAAMFAGLPVSKIAGVLAFFLQCKAVYDRHSKAYSNLARTADQLPTSIKHFLRLGGGIKLSTIWQTVRYYVMTRLLRYQLQKFLRTYSTKKIKVTRKTRSIN